MSPPRPGALTFVRPSGVFLALVAVTGLTGALLWAGATQRWLVFVFVLAGWVVSLSLHEFGHAVSAYRGGDSSVVAKGYLSLDPRRYTVPLLSIGLPVLFVLAGGIGLPGGAVWIERSAIRARSALSLVSAAGPATNLALAVVVLLPLGAGWIDPAGRVFFATGLAWLGILQIAAAFLNLLPIPGLDGYGIIEPYLPPELRARLAPIAGWSLLLVFFLLWRVEALAELFWDRVFGLADLLGVAVIFPVCGQLTFEFWNTLPVACTP